MTQPAEQPKKKSNLLSVLDNHLRALIAARAEKEIVTQYMTLLALLKRHGLDGLEAQLKARAERARKQTRLDTAVDLAKVSLQELLDIVEDDDTPRRYLEKIAITRFGVPSGSMRSFSNRRLLVDKLRSLIRNEQAHATIGNLARKESFPK